MDVAPYLSNIPENFLEFIELVKEQSPVPLHSVYVVGSVLTPDYNDGYSDVNSVIIVEERGLVFFDFLVRLGCGCRTTAIAPPLVMTPGYILDSLDVFPIEFLNFQAIHHTLFGNDILRPLRIKKKDLRLQCEREMKAKLLWLGQVYIETLGDKRVLSERLAASFNGFLPIFRAVLYLYGREIGPSGEQVFRDFQENSGIGMDSFMRLYTMKREGRQDAAPGDFSTFFNALYRATEQVAGYVDQLSV